MKRSAFIAVVFGVVGAVALACYAQTGLGEGGLGEGGMGGGEAKPGAAAPAPKAATSRVPFAELFDLKQGKITPKKPVRVGPTTLSPAVTMACGVVKVSGIDLCTLEGHDLSVEQQGNVSVITGYFK